MDTYTVTIKIKDTSIINNINIFQKKIIKKNEDLEFYMQSPAEIHLCLSTIKMASKDVQRCKEILIEALIDFKTTTPKIVKFQGIYKSGKHILYTKPITGLSYLHDLYIHLNTTLYSNEFKVETRKSFNPYLAIIKIPRKTPFYTVEEIKENNALYFGEEKIDEIKLLSVQQQDKYYIEEDSFSVLC